MKTKRKKKSPKLPPSTPTGQMMFDCHRSHDFCQPIFDPDFPSTNPVGYMCRKCGFSTFPKLPIK